MSDNNLELPERLLDENARLKKENESLREQIRLLTSDPYSKMYAGMLKQWNNIADDLNALEISFSLSPEIDDDEEDAQKIKEANRKARINKAMYERFMEIMESSKKMMDSLEWLRKKTGLETDQESKPKNKPVKSPLEERAR